MDINQFVTKLNWKKLLVIVLACAFAFWLIREMMFLEFLRVFKNTYSQFTTQFDQDQKSIHNIIENNFKKQEAMQRDMDKKTEEFHDYVDQSMNKTFAYLNNDKTSPKQSDGNNTASTEVKEGEHDWQLVQKAFLTKNGKPLPSYEELKKNASMDAIDDAREKELDLMEQSEIKETWKKEREELNKKYWEMARQRYFQTTGKMLPSYEEIIQSTTAYRNENHE